MTIENNKICSNPECKQINPQSLDNFHKRIKSADGYFSRCKSCVKEYQVGRRDEINKKQKELYWKDPEKARKKALEQYYKDPEKALERNRKRREANPNIDDEIKQRWRDNNREKHNQYSRNWYKNNPEKAKELSRKKRFKKYGITEGEYNEMLATQNNKCEFCKQDLTNQKTHIDHCHTTNKVRRILCGSCNKTYGTVKENAETLKKMAEAALEDTVNKKLVKDEE